MSARRSLGLPITLAVVMIVLLVALGIGWVLLAVFGAISERGLAPLYWTLLSVGSVFLIVVLVGVVTYLVLTIKAINLNQRQSNFMDSITHELKSPIASLKLYLQTLRLRQVSEQERMDFHRYMLEDVERLDSLINHLLNAARVERQESEQEIEELEMSQLLQQCVQSVCLRYRVAVDTVRIDAEPCVIMARQVDAEMIFRNLIDNAVKYAGIPPQVELTVRTQPDGQIVTRIADNGAGIPARLRRKIFGRFVRLGLELQRETPGTGLGLYIVLTLVQKLRGRVRVQDGPSGKGTVFEVRLPGRRVEHSEEDAEPLKQPKDVEVV